MKSDAPSRELLSRAATDEAPRRKDRTPKAVRQAYGGGSPRRSAALGAGRDGDDDRRCVAIEARTADFDEGAFTKMHPFVRPMAVRPMAVRPMAEHAAPTGEAQR